MTRNDIEDVVGEVLKSCKNRRNTKFVRRRIVNDIVNHIRPMIEETRKRDEPAN